MGARPAGKPAGRQRLKGGLGRAAMGSKLGPAQPRASPPPALSRGLLGPAAPSPRHCPRPAPRRPSRPPQADPVNEKWAGTGGLTRPAGRHSRVPLQVAPAYLGQGLGSRAIVSGSRSAGLSWPRAELNLESGTWLLPPTPKRGLISTSVATFLAIVPSSLVYSLFNFCFGASNTFTINFPTLLGIIRSLPPAKYHPSIVHTLPSLSPL